jgi:hypothetical protein
MRLLAGMAFGCWVAGVAVAALARAFFAAHDTIVSATAEDLDATRRRQP